MCLTFATMSQNLLKHKATATHRTWIKAEHTHKKKSPYILGIPMLHCQSETKNLRCPYLQKVVSGLTTVIVFENKSSNVEKTHVTAVKTSASYYSKEYAAQEYKMGNTWTDISGGCKKEIRSSKFPRPENRTSGEKSSENNKSTA